MPSCVFVTHYAPSDVGHGGMHRSYQIANDLRQIFAETDFHLVSLPIWRNQNDALSSSSGSTITDGMRQRLPANHFLRRVWRKSLSPFRAAKQQVTKMRSYQQNPMRFLARLPLPDQLQIETAFIQNYKNLLQNLPRPIISVLEHPAFSDLIEINQQYEAATLICPQNLESLDNSNNTEISWLRKTHAYTTLIDFSHELSILAHCSHRLFISQVETALINGLGLPSIYYPYLPVGVIRERQLQIRAKRSEKGVVEQGLFLMLGSAAHPTTKKSFEWFITQADLHGLPEKARVVVAGNGTDTLLRAKPKREQSNIKLLGWLEQSELDDLLCIAQAMLIPQNIGFGALTRLSELACAGIPMIVSTHATYAIETPPGVWPVTDTWNDWFLAMQTILSGHFEIPEQEYDRWESQQPKPLTQVIHDLL